MTNELREKMSEFEKWLLVRKGISYVTIAGYKGSASRIIRFLKTFEPTHDQVINYIVKMHERGFSYSHIVNTSLALEWYTEFIGNRIQLGRPKKPRTTIKKGNRYDQSDLRKLVHVLAKRARINKRIYPHLLRHSLATNLLKRGANLYMIKEQLGHVFLETTATYLRTFPLNIRNQYHMFVPSYM